MSGMVLSAPNQGVLDRQSEIITDLCHLIGSMAVISDDDGRRAYETDALTAYRQMPLAVVLPQTTEEVSRILRYCFDKGVKVVARGAGTSLAGGALPAADAIVLGVSRMNRVLDINFENRVARVQSGITNLQISNSVSGEDYFYAPDPSSQLACTLAGNIAMNSGGAHCLKYGVTTNNVLGVTMVLMDGEIVELGGDYLDSAGYDLLALVVGSEGQMGIVTEATVRILRKAEGARPILLGFDSSEVAGACVSAIMASGMVPVAIEFMDKPAIHTCEQFAGAGYPLDVEAMLIIEVEGSSEEMIVALERIKSIAAEFSPKTVRISQSDAESAAIWKGRKSAFGAVGALGDYLCMDGTIPLGQLPKVLKRISEICDGYGFRVANIFHAGDGNLHPLVLYDANAPGELEGAEECGAEILKLCVEVGGCLTGEHGVGVEKRELMSFQFEPIDLAQQMRVKSVFDPEWLLNPGKVFPLELRNMS